MDENNTPQVEEEQVPFVPPQTNPIEEDKPSVVPLTTREEALAAGVPEDIFDPDVHLFSETVTRVATPTEVIETYPQETTNDAEPTP